jgi:hypothetical protein
MSEGLHPERQRCQSLIPDGDTCGRALLATACHGYPFLHGEEQTSRGHGRSGDLRNLAGNLDLVIFVILLACRTLSPVQNLLNL